MTKVYIIRHAEAEGNLYRRIHGQYDSLLTDSGFEQVKSLAKRFESIPIDAVYSSDMTRTKLTAAAIFRQKGLPLYTTARLREINMGIWEDVTWGDVEHETPELLRLYTKEPYNWSIPKAENFRELTQRIVTAVLDIAKEHEGGSVAIVTHGSAIKALLRYALNIPESELGGLQYSDNTAVSLLLVENGEIKKVEFYNDNSHLPGQQSTFARQHWWKSKSGSDNLNMRFAEMDLEKNGKEYLERYHDAWRIAHGTSEGFGSRYLKSAALRAAKYPHAIMRSYLGDKPTGIIDLDIETDAAEKAGNIAFYYMDENYRGRDLGVQLIGYAVSIFRPMGRDRLRLRVADTNLKAIKFYERYGFKKVGTQPGSVGTLLVMEKDIGFPNFTEEIKL